MDLFSVGVLVPLGFFLFIIILVYLGNQKKIRLSLINKGLDPNTFKNENHQNTALRTGIFMSAIGVGILVANGIAALGWLSQDVAFLSMLFIFGGLALIGSGFLNRKNN
ncbi:MAG: hypothetical protein J7K39_05465 [Bacteroidales bacterium]|nr:hypothetical protein [Bacteroidales bacterium]RLD39113.1 MAG: hypothetical protein DRI74_01770 [Bacteroidota bacterium]